MPINIQEAISSYNVQNATRNKVKLFAEHKRNNFNFLNFFMENVYTFNSQYITIGVDEYETVNDVMEVPTVFEGQDTPVEYVGSSRLSETAIQKFETATVVTTEGINSEKGEAEYVAQLDKKMVYLKSQMNISFKHGSISFPTTANASLPYKTKGFFKQVTTNIVDGESSKLDVLMLYELLKLVNMNSQFGITDNHYLVANAEVLQAVTDLFKTLVEPAGNDRYIAGASLQKLISRYGSPLKLVEDRTFQSNEIAIIEKDNVGIGTIAKKDKDLFYTKTLSTNGDYEKEGLYVHGGAIVINEKECGIITGFTL